MDKELIAVKRKLLYNIRIDKGGNMEVILSPKYQVVIPKEVRRRLKLKSGQRLQIIVRGGTITLVPDYPLEELRGLFKGMQTKGVREEGERI
jgi:AbrB family looped-hinge helix DNA binding protein